MKNSKKYNSSCFLFVICVNNEKLYEVCKFYISQLDIPDSFTIEYLPIYNATSMTEGYNQALKHSAKYKIYLHQDVFIQHLFFLKDILEIFVSDPQIGFIGMIGCSKLPNSGIWWQTPTINGKVIDYVDKQKRYLDFQKNNEYVSSTFIRAEAVDGLLIATQYDLPWKEDLFNGFHFYDVSQCLEFKKAGYRGAIPLQKDYWCVHYSITHAVNEQIYENYRQILIQNYQDVIE
ncbi:streptomycin biosynthesis protein StrF [Bacillus cereus]|uniref:Streptomycin biosynthesis protein StrF n=1 Tax=Bacillus cereus TaxID=1396 RepID=A0A1S9TAR9_BACCE|nr:glycosyltransferase family protein [Bacillus cereus]OOR06661.1 streptomycin biosynthesis protein StrF [Bacillus cereus]